MRTLLAETLTALANWLRPKAMPASLAGNPWTGSTYMDAFKRSRQPTPNELMAELKGAAWTCASINAAVCASFPPKLYVATHAGQPAAKCPVKDLEPAAERRLRNHPRLPAAATKARQLQEVLDHPLLTLLRQVNPTHNSFDLWELTTLYQEVHGSAYWYLNFDTFGVPDEIWLLPAQNVTPKRAADSPNIVDYYSYRTGATEQRFDAASIIHFRYPDPRDPYHAGLSPLRACWEQVALASDYAAMKKAVYENTGIPSAIISPTEVIGEEERDRIEAQWNQKFRRGGAGRVLVAEAALQVDVLSHSMGDLAALADLKATKEDIANAFHVPLSFLTSQTNLANLQAAEHQHMAKAIQPRLLRRDEKLNEQLIPLYDPSGRLFVASEDPVPVNQDLTMKERELNLKYGIVTINEVRQERGLPPVAWGDVPWLPLIWAPTDLPERHLLAPRESDPHIGRNKPVAEE